MALLPITMELPASHKLAELHLMTKRQIRLHLQLSALHIPELLDRKDTYRISVEKPEVP